VKKSRGTSVRHQNEQGNTPGAQSGQAAQVGQATRAVAQDKQQRGKHSSRRVAVMSKSSDMRQQKEKASESGAGLAKKVEHMKIHCIEHDQKNISQIPNILAPYQHCQSILIQNLAFCFPPASPDS